MYFTHRTQLVCYATASTIAFYDAALEFELLNLCYCYTAFAL